MVAAPDGEMNEQVSWEYCDIALWEHDKAGNICILITKPSQDDKFCDIFMSHCFCAFDSVEGVVNIPETLNFLKFYLF